MRSFGEWLRERLCKVGLFKLEWCSAWSVPIDGSVHCLLNCLGHDLYDLTKLNPILANTPHYHESYSFDVSIIIGSLGQRTLESSVSYWAKLYVP